MILFYAAECDGKKAQLIESEAIHCRQALRKKIGDQLYITDGLGHAYLAEIIMISKKSIDLLIHSTLDLIDQRKYKIHIAIAPTKNISRFEWFLEKATELGIDEITPLLCERSERKVIKAERLTKILLSAMKQSLKTSIPKLNPLTKYKDFVSQTHFLDRYIAHLEDENTPFLIDCYPKGNDVLVMIGPEGDFSTREIKLANEHKFQSASLGNYRLRTETAGISAVQAIHFCNALS